MRRAAVTGPLLERSMELARIESVLLGVVDGVVLAHKAAEAEALGR
jgi:hypothetical protein